MPTSFRIIVAVAAAKVPICYPLQIMNYRATSLIVFLCVLHSGIAIDPDEFEFSRDLSANKTTVIYRNLHQKMVLFTTANQPQFLKFNNNNRRSLLDFAVCIWFRPTRNATEHYLFTYFASSNISEPSIMWKIMKKDGNSYIKLQIVGKSVIEEKMDIIPIGFWYHICTQWQGSTGFWAVFVNSRIFSLGYHSSKESPTSSYNIAGTGNAFIGNKNDTISIHGDVYGFYLTSLESNFRSDLVSTITPNSKSDFTDDSVSSTSKPRTRLVSNVIIRRRPSKKTYKRDAILDTIPVDQNKDQYPFPRVGKFLAFVKRLFTFVVFPMFKLFRNTWQQRAMYMAPESATEIITDFHDDSLTSAKSGNIEEEAVTKASFSASSSSSSSKQFIASTAAYKIDFESFNQRTSRETTKVASEKCTKSEQDEILNFVNVLLTKFTAPLAQNSLNKFAHAIDFVKNRYFCCEFQLSNSTVISWDHTSVTTCKDSVLSDVSGCVYF